MSGEDDILQRLARVETKLDILLEDREAIKEATKVANAAFQSASSAHHRLNDMQSGQRWLIGITISAVALFLTAIGFLWKVAEGL